MRVTRRNPDVPYIIEVSTFSAVSAVKRRFVFYTDPNESRTSDKCQTSRTRWDGLYIKPPPYVEAVDYLCRLQRMIYWRRQKIKTVCGWTLEADRSTVCKKGFIRVTRPESERLAVSGLWWITASNLRFCTSVGLILLLEMFSEHHHSTEHVELPNNMACTTLKLTQPNLHNLLSQNQQPSQNKKDLISFLAFFGCEAF